MTRLRVALAAVVLAGLAAWALASFRPASEPPKVAHPLIDKDSREQLEDVLRDSRDEP